MVLDSALIRSQLLTKGELRHSFKKIGSKKWIYLHSCFLKLSAAVIHRGDLHGLVFVFCIVDCRLELKGKCN